MSNQQSAVCVAYVKQLKRRIERASSNPYSHTIAKMMLNAAMETLCQHRGYSRDMLNATNHKGKQRKTDHTRRQFSRSTTTPGQICWIATQIESSDLQWLKQCLNTETEQETIDVIVQHNRNGLIPSNTRREIERRLSKTINLRQSSSPTIADIWKALTQTGLREESSLMMTVPTDTNHLPSPPEWYEQNWPESHRMMKNIPSVRENIQTRTVDKDTNIYTEDTTQFMRAEGTSKHRESFAYLTVHTDASK